MAASSLPLWCDASVPLWCDVMLELLSSCRAMQLKTIMWNARRINYETLDKSNRPDIRMNVYWATIEYLFSIIVFIDALQYMLLLLSNDHTDYITCTNEMTNFYHLNYFANVCLMVKCYSFVVLVMYNKEYCQNHCRYYSRRSVCWFGNYSQDMGCCLWIEKCITGHAKGKLANWLVIAKYAIWKI